MPNNLHLEIRAGVLENLECVPPLSSQAAVCFSVWYGRMQPDSAVNSLLSAMSNTCFLLDRVLLSLGYVQCNLMTL